MHAIGCLLLFLFVIVMTIVAVIWNTLQALFGGKKSVNSYWKMFRHVYNGTKDTQSSRQEEKSQERNEGSEKKKVFVDGEGEYVDYEEVKDEH
jgi:hypothetical protein